MASVPGSAAPSLFLRNATGLVKGWSGFDAFSVLVHVGQPGHAGHVLQPGGLRLRPRGEPDPVDRPRGRRGHVPGRRLRRAHRGDAAGRRRLHLAEPHPRRDPRHPDRRGRRRDRVLPRRPMPLALGDAIALVARASSASSSAGSSAGSTVASGSSWPPPAGGSSSRCGRRSTARSSTSSSSSRSPRWSSRPTACRSSPRRTASCSSRS